MGTVRIVKVTVDIPNSLYRRANRHAADQGITFRKIVESGVLTIVEQERPEAPFRLRKASFAGDGLLPGLTWDEIREGGYDKPKVVPPTQDS